MTGVHKKGKPLDIQFSMIVPGRRALGEAWSKVTIGVNHDTDEVEVHREDAEEPADKSPIVVLGPQEQEYADYILEAAMEKAKARGKTVQELVADREEYAKALNEMWQDYMADKVRWFKGQSQIGATGHLTQRQRVNRNPNG